MARYIKHLNQQYSKNTTTRKINYIKHNFGRDLDVVCNKKGIVLEIGPGNGECISYANGIGISKIDIIDDDKEILDNLNKKFKIRNCMKLDIGKLNNQLTSKYDLIFMIQVLEHIPVETAKRIVKLLYSKLNLKGKLIVVVPNANNPLGITERYGDIQHKVSYTEQSLKDLIIYSQISNYDLEIKGYEIPPYNVINIIRIILQKILHFILLLLMVVNGGTYFRIMTPNITLVVKRVY
jgi:2-polyprenyl-3-methyl-5-hydroxy-6-metoxy-1,4-benzoquinol methylase